jgi:O-acetyl-ADP-ribose deacetylase (regulator of RNase III)
MNLHILDGDLLDQDVEVIVNAWNRNFIPWWLLLPRVGLIPLGGAVVTGPGRLPFKAIIHVAGINLLWRSSERSVRDSVRNAVESARSRGYRSIALPLVGAGSGGGRADRVLEWMSDELAGIEYDGEVRLVRYKPRKRDIPLGPSRAPEPGL